MGAASDATGRLEVTIMVNLLIEASGSNSRERVRGLLIDDDRDDVSLIDKLSRKSKQLDIALTICRSVDDATAKLATQEFDVVYVDYWLGFETSIPFIHNFAHENHAPCILVTCFDEPDIGASPSAPASRVFFPRRKSRRRRSRASRSRR